MNAPAKLGIIAGGGTAPRELLAACVRAKRPYFLICLEGQADADLGQGHPHMIVPFGKGGTIRDALKNEAVRELVMIGRVRRPTLAELKPDLFSVRMLGRIGFSSFGDDGLLRAIGRVLEDECGVRMVAAHEVFSDLLAPLGVLTEAQPDAGMCADLDRGREVASALGLLDVGQAVVVQQGLVLGVEAIEGTDALLARVAGLGRAGQGGVLVKAAKPQQDERFDLPAIGPETVKKAKEAGLSGIAIEAGRSLILCREETLAAANAAGLFIVAFDGTPRP